MNFSSMFQNSGMLGGTASQSKLDNSETVIVSHLALVKMLRHCKAGVPIEVMGILLGSFVDDYTVYVSDVFAMPQVGSSDNVEAIDDVFQTQMLEMLKSVSVHENSIGWYHSHPGYYSWLSSVDQQTQALFEKLNPRSIAIVVDPINSTHNRIVMESFRLISGGMGFAFSASSGDTRLVTSDIGFLRRKEPMTLLRGLDRSFYQMPIKYSKMSYERTILGKLGQKLWVDILGDEDEPHSGNSAADTRLARNMKTLRGAIALAKETDSWRQCSEAAEALLQDCVKDDVNLILRATAFMN